MNLKNSVKYQILDSRISIPVFYIAIFLLMGFLTVSSSTIAMGSNVNVGINGVETATIIFLFIVGLNSFRETFRMMMQNGITRKTMFKGFIITASVLSIGMSLINEIILFFGRALMAKNPGITFQSLFEQIYGSATSADSKLWVISHEIIFVACLSLAAISLGYFITVMYYRLNKPGKIAVSIGIPATFIVVIPIFDAVVTGGQIHRAMGQLMLFAFGLHNSYNPVYAMISSLIFSGIFLLLSWLLIRRAAVKN